MPKEYACRKCKALTMGRVCPNCQSSDISPDWSGIIVILNDERSSIAKALKITRPGRYAQRVA